MKIGNSAENTLVTNVDDTKRNKFKIQATGKAFSILSNALYQHKVKAVVREIGCNAYDAHIDAGNTQTPFVVTLPCKEDPHFTVRDYGIGLAEDKFVEIYTTYFGSSKADSNDHTGGLGLGSKTPFIMSKSFTVHSYYNGTEYMWHSFVNDNGEPDVMMLHSKATTEPNGLKVIVPIGQGMSDTEKNALFRDFKAEAEEIYKWFDTPPTVTVNKVPVLIARILDNPKTKYTSLKLTGVEGTTVYYTSAQDKVGQSSNIMVKMGNVVYPYDLSKVRSLDRFGGNIVQTERIIRYITTQGRLNPTAVPLVVEVGMGDVDIAPSREALSLNNTTELTIINAIVRFTDMFFNAVQQSIDNAKTTFEKYQALYLVPAMGGKNFTIAGKEVDPHKMTPSWMFGNAQDTAGKTDSVLRWFNTDKYCVKYRRAQTRGILPMKNSFNLEMYGPGIKNRTVLLVDTAYKGELRLWVNANTPHDSAVVVVFGEDFKGGRSTPRPLTAAEMAPFLEDGHPQVVKFSQLKVTPSLTSSTRSSAPSLKVTSEDAIVMQYTDTTYNYFTAGNGSTKSVDSILKEFDPKKTEMVGYIALVKKGDKILGEVADPDPTTPAATQFVQLSYWSRAQGKSTVWQQGTEFLNECIHRIPQRLGVDHFKTEVLGKTYTLKVRGSSLTSAVRQMLLSQEAYDAVVDNPDYPHIFSVDRAIRELTIPALPKAVEVVVVDATHSFVGNQNSRGSALRKFMTEIGMPNFLSLQDRIYTQTNTDAAQGITTFKKHVSVKEYGYDKLLQCNTVVTYTYNFPSQHLLQLVNAAIGDGMQGLTYLRQWLQMAGNNLDKLMATGYYNNADVTVRFLVDQLGYSLRADGFNATKFDDYVVKYVESNRKVS